MAEREAGLFDLPGLGEVLYAPARARKVRAAPSWRQGERPRQHDSAPRLAAIARMLALASRAPEVMVKITGVNKEPGPLKAHLRYLLGKDAAVAEDEHGAEVECSRAGVAHVMASWGVAVAEGRENERRSASVSPVNPKADKRHDSRKTIAVHIVLSMPEGTPADLVMASARGFATQELSNHPHLLVLHTDRDHPHVHVVVNNVGYDLQRLARRREDLQRWREVFARELNARGIAAAATPRKARGVVQKAERFALIQASERLARERREASPQARPEASTLRVLRGRVERAVSELRGRALEAPSQAERRARQNRQLLEVGIAGAIAHLQASGEEAESARLEAWRASLPAAETRHEALGQRLRAMLERAPGPQQVFRRPESAPRDRS